MTDIGRNRAIITSVAAIAIILGLALVGQMPKATATPPPAPKQAPAAAVGGVDAPGEQFMVRDYSDFSQGADADLVSSDWLGLLAGMVVKLALVVALIYLAFVVLRRYFHQGRVAASHKKPVSLLGSLNLSPNRTVYVLEVGRKVLVVGATQSQLSLLTEVTDPEAADEVRAISSETPAIGQFSSLLSVAGRQFKAKDIALLDASVVDPIQIKIHEGRDFMQRKLANIRESLKLS